MKILVVDDDDCLRGSVAAMLAACGHDVTEASSISSGQQRLDGHDVVVHDLNLGPQRLTQAVIEAYRPVPVIVLTGDPASVVESGMRPRDVVSKAQPRQLLDVLATVAAERS